MPLMSSFVEVLALVVPLQVEDTTSSKTENIENHAIVPFPWSTFLAQACFILVIQILLQKWLLPSIARKVLTNLANPSIENETIAKCSASMMGLGINCTLGVLGLAVTRTQDWMMQFKLDQLWENQPSNYLYPKGVESFYILTGAINFSSLISLFLLKRSKDFAEMLIHHLVTTVLIIYSFQLGMVRIGLALMVLVSFADPPLHLAKLAKYLSDHSPVDSTLRQMFSRVADVFFFLFAAIFTVTRGLVLPTIAFSSLYRGYETLEESMRHMDSKIIGCISMLFVLCVLQFYWISLIAKVLINVVIVGENVDENLAYSKDKKQQ